MAITVSLIFQPVWSRIRDHLHIVECPQDGGAVNDPRIRIEFLGLSEKAARELVTVTMPCVACERPNFPLRIREGDAWDMGRLYYAPTCPITTRMACSRGRAAELEYERFKGLRLSRPVSAQLALF